MLITNARVIFTCNEKCFLRFQVIGRKQISGLIDVIMMINDMHLLTINNILRVEFSIHT